MFVNPQTRTEHYNDIMYKKESKLQETLNIYTSIFTRDNGILSHPFAKKMKAELEAPSSSPSRH